MFDFIDCVGEGGGSFTEFPRSFHSRCEFIFMYFPCGLIYRCINHVTRTIYDEKVTRSGKENNRYAIITFRELTIFNFRVPRHKTRIVNRYCARTTRCRAISTTRYIKTDDTNRKKVQRKYRDFTTVTLVVMTFGISIFIRCNEWHCASLILIFARCVFKAVSRYF